MNILQLQQSKHSSQKQKIVMMTCYDYTSAKIIDNTTIDGILIGDSAAMVMHGHPNTITASAEMLIWHTQAVSRGITQNKFIVSDLPFLTHRHSLNKTMTLVQKLIQAGAHAIKIEGARGNEKTIRHLVESGIPVIGHIGLTAQFYHQLGGFKVQGRNHENAKELLAQAQIFQDTGCSALVLEGIPSDLAHNISQTLRIPTIGIGAGPYTDGQILVWQDLLGLNLEHRPKFVKTFLNGAELFQQAINDYAEEVKHSTFPCLNTHCYS